MNLLTVSETKDKLVLKVHYTDTDGTQFEIIKQPFPRAAQLRKLAIAMREMSERIGSSV